MPKILIAECRQEVSSFNPVLSHYDDFKILEGDKIFELKSARQEIAGALNVFEKRSAIQIIPTYSAHSITSGGHLAGDDFNRIASEFLQSIKAVPPVDAVYFSLHGSMVSEGEEDPEGFLLQESRKILGEAIPIVTSLDMHGILTDRMVKHSDAIVVFHTYPHVDFYETGERAAKLLLKILDDGVKPVTAKVEIPALVRGDELKTETGLFGQSIRKAQAIENSPRGLSAGMFIGNPFTDVPDLRSYSLVVTDNDRELAESEALNLAHGFWEVREKLQAPLDSMEDAVRIAKETKGTVILFDAADATSSGASGDSNAIMRALIDASYKGRVLLPIVDSQAVNAAFENGVGSIIETQVGGFLDAKRFSPLSVKARVRLLSDGMFINESYQRMWNSGLTAVLEADNYTIVVTSRPVDLYDRSLFLAMGQDPKNFDLVVVKSPHCQYQFYEEWAACHVNVDAPGSTSANLKSLGHTRCARPVFPLDDDVTFNPQVKIFRRPA